MNWIKANLKAFLAAIAAFLAFMAVASAASSKAKAEKWAKIAEDEKAKDVADSVGKANAALTQAKLHNAKAAEAKEKAKAKIDVIAAKDPAMADIVNGWKKARLK